MSKQAQNMGAIRKNERPGGCAYIGKWAIPTNTYFQTDLKAYVKLTKTLIHPVQSVSLIKVNQFVSFVSSVSLNRLHKTIIIDDTIFFFITIEILKKSEYAAQLKLNISKIEALHLSKKFWDAKISK